MVQLTIKSRNYYSISRLDKGKKELKNKNQIVTRTRKRDEILTQSYMYWDKIINYQYNNYETVELSLFAWPKKLSS